MFWLKKINIVLLLFFCVFHQQVLGAYPKDKSGETSIQSEIQLIKSCISQGATKNAVLLSDRILSKIKTKHARYEVRQLKAKAYLIEENMTGFIEECEQAFLTRPNNQPAYRALYCAQKSAFYHYLIIADSALKYANQAMWLKTKFPEMRSTIPTYLIDQVFAISFLYRIRPRNYNKKYYSEFQEHFAPLQFYFMKAWKDACSDKRVLPFERALLLRSMANRKFDYLGYTIRTKKEADLLDESKKIVHQEILRVYRKALRFCPKEDIETRTSIMSLMSLSHFVMANYGEGLRIYSGAIQMINNRYLSCKNLPTVLNCCKLINYRMRICELDRLNESTFIRERTLLNQLLPKWEEYMADQKAFAYDTYNSSPHLSLSILHYNQYKRTNKRDFLYKSVSHALSALKIWHPIRSIDILKNGYKEWRFIKNGRLKKAIARRLYPLNESHITEVKKQPVSSFNVKDLQCQIRDNEGFIFQGFVFGDLIPKKVFLTRDTLVLFESKGYPNTADYVEHKVNFTTYKKKAYRDYKIHFEPILRQFPFINRVYLNHENLENYAALITSTSGMNYNELSFLGKKIDFVRVYDPTEPTRNAPLKKVHNLLHFVFAYDSKRSEFPFNSAVFSEPLSGFSSATPKNSLVSSLQQKGIVHYIGHGEFVADNKTNWKSPVLLTPGKSTTQADILDVKVKKDLVVLSSCYAGAIGVTAAKNRYFVLRLLYNGAKAVIASPYQVDDESSAFIFQKFYANLSKGFTVEDALFRAKKDYLNAQPGERCHPLFWSGFQLTTRQLKMQLVTRPMQFFTLIKWLFLPFSLVLIILFYRYFPR